MTPNDIEEIDGLNRADLAWALATCFPCPTAIRPHPYYRIGAEIGVQKGEYAEMILKAALRLPEIASGALCERAQCWVPTRLLLVDLWARQSNYMDIANVPDAEHAKNLRETVRRMEAFPFRSSIHIGPSVETARAQADDSLDFIYLDADHKHASVKADLEAWYPKVRAGGWISGHDYLDSPNCCGSEFGVRTAVREFCARIGVGQVAVCRTEPFPNWHFIKPPSLHRSAELLLKFGRHSMECVYGHQSGCICGWSTIETKLRAELGE